LTAEEWDFKGQARRTSNREKFRKIYFSVDFLSFLYYIKLLNGTGKFIFRCCPRRKHLFAHASQGRHYYFITHFTLPGTKFFYILPVSMKIG
jgi:hypothetical protein